jgi:mono/diheme cytochrome c family protein
MKRFLLGAMSGLAAVLLVAMLLASTGVISVSALWKQRALDEWLAYASQRSITHHADARLANPFRGDPTALAEGLAHYKANCLACHGAPGMEISEFARGLNPPAPDLAARSIQAMSDGELYWIVSNGIRMTGMPAFSVTHDENERWRIIAFVRQLWDLNDAERTQLASVQSDEAEHHHHEESEPSRPQADGQHGDEEHHQH